MMGVYPTVSGPVHTVEVAVLTPRPTGCRRRSATSGRLCYQERSETVGLVQQAMLTEEKGGGKK